MAGIENVGYITKQSNPKGKEDFVFVVFSGFWPKTFADLRGAVKWCLKKGVKPVFRVKYIGSQVNLVESVRAEVAAEAAAEAAEDDSDQEDEEYPLASPLRPV